MVGPFFKAVHASRRSAIIAVAIIVNGSPVWAQQSACGAEPKDVPNVVQDKLRGDVAGKAQLLSRFLGDSQLTGAIETSRFELYQNHQDVDKYQIDRYFAWVACGMIMADGGLTSNQKTEKWLIVYRTLMSKPAPTSDR